MSDNDERATADDDAKEDLELKDEDADQVRGGLASKSQGVHRLKDVAGA